MCYATPPASQVNSIIWPNPAFDNNITIYGPEVKALAGRYLSEMIAELKASPDPDGSKATLFDSIDPAASPRGQQDDGVRARHRCGTRLKLYFNIERVANTSSATPPCHSRRRPRRGHQGTRADLRRQASGPARSPDIA